jgi:tetratricopeptide (TPR) repeat protein
MPNRKRDRGHILTETGRQKLQRAISQWEEVHHLRCTQERMRELTIPFRANGLDPGTISKIVKVSKAVDFDSIHYLFQAFHLQLDRADIVLSNWQPTHPNLNFVGRERALAELNLLVHQGAKAIVIQGRGGVGKTTLARKFLKSQATCLVLEKWMATEPQNITSVESVVEEWLRRYFDEEPGREFGITLDRLRYRLRHSSCRVGILLDNFEVALDGNGKLIEQHSRYVDLLKVLADPESNCLTVITSRERLHCPVLVHHYLLEGLNLKAWKQFFQEKDIGSTPAVKAMHRFYNGNAIAMEIVRSIIFQEYNRQAEVYWAENQTYLPREIEDLISNQFDRLKRISTDEYKLLCRLGCYRYQDVTSVPIEGVMCMLWDVPEPLRRRVVLSLQRRALLIGRKDQYWLHPVIRMEALQRLCSTDAWEMANRKAADYLSQSTISVLTTKDALRALEPYYHYMQINDISAAADTLIAKRLNRWGTNESLGRSFYKRGLLRQMTNVITNIVDKLEIETRADKLEQSYRKAKLYHTLGAIRWLTGDIHTAIQYCQDARQLAYTALQHPIAHNDAVLNLRLVEINSLLTMGMCKIGLWELDIALSELSEAWRLCQLLDCEKYSLSVLFYIAFLQSCLGSHREALATADHLFACCEPLLNQSLPSWLTEYRLSYLGQTYNNLGDSEKALLIYDHVLAYTEKSLHAQAKVKVHNCKAEFYRCQQNFDDAMKCHLKAIGAASVIGAKYDLAEAYYQQGLTFQAMEQPEKSHLSFQEAIQRFNAIQAPRQVERVRKMLVQ